MESAPGAAEEPQLRHVEKDVLIPKMMREKARELCSDKVQGESEIHQNTKSNHLCDLNLIIFQAVTGAVNIAFTKCCQESGILMVVKCREENAALKECVTGYYNDPSFYEECKAEYLKQREEFRETGNRRKQQRLPTSM
nr:COX assembly mitochondrial protein homolog isoform X1 [Zootoca vivipara]